MCTWSRWPQSLLLELGPHAGGAQSEAFLHMPGLVAASPAHVRCCRRENRCVLGIFFVGPASLQAWWGLRSGQAGGACGELLPEPWQEGCAARPRALGRKCHRETASLCAGTRLGTSGLEI